MWRLQGVELAARLGISKSYLSEIESGKKAPSVEIIERYASEFQIPASSILFFSEHLGDPSSAEARAFNFSKLMNRSEASFALDRRRKNGLSRSL